LELPVQEPKLYTIKAESISSTSNESFSREFTGEPFDTIVLSPPHAHKASAANINVYRKKLRIPFSFFTTGSPSPRNIKNPHPKTN
jgi:hypothetical protein